MWTEISLVGGLVMAGGRLAAEVSGETKRRRDDSYERALERREQKNSGKESH